jgi:uncharacterized membrane protein YphA (DoxX/SURF4 family)
MGLVRLKEEPMNKIASKLPTVARVLLGGMFVFSGLNGFLQFAPMPPMPPAAGALLGAMGAAGYLFPLIKGTELIAGLLLLSGRFVPLALTVLAPVLVNIVAFHAALAPAGVGAPVVLAALEGYLAYQHRGAFASLLRTEASRATEEHPAPSSRLASAA